MIPRHLQSTLCTHEHGFWTFLRPPKVPRHAGFPRGDAVQGTLKSLLQHQSSKASILRCSAFFIVQLSHPYMTTGKTIALTRWTFVGKVMSLLFKMLSRLVITFLPRSKRLLISWLQSPSIVILVAREGAGCGSVGDVPGAWLASAPLSPSLWT